MKIIAAMHADLHRAPLGQASRLSSELCGKTVLRRTTERALRASRLSAVHVLAGDSQRDDVAALLEGCPARVGPSSAAPPPYAALVAAGRAWGAEGWRGGIGGLCWFDEDLDLPAAAALAARERADALAWIPAHAALIAPDLIDAMIEHYERFVAAQRLTFTTAPPGLAPVIFAAELLAELAAAGQPPGILLAYQPGRPVMDLTGRECCYRPAAVVSETRGRILADTRRGLDGMRRLIESGAEAWTADDIAARWRTLAEEAATGADGLGLPEEIEIELTTDDPLAAATRLRPRGAAVGLRGPIDLRCIRRIAEGLRGADDVRVVLGGFGEPLAHPAVGEIVRILRAAGAGSIAVRTTGLAGDEALDEELFAIPVDVLNVTLDAVSPEGYRRAHGADAFERAAARVERWIARRERSRQVRPVIVPELMKSTLTFDEMEPFFDRWLGRLGCAAISAYSRCAGQRPDLAVTPMAPPRRVACRRLFSRMLILADGRVVACDQDFTGRCALGDLSERTASRVDEGDARLLDGRSSTRPTALRDIWTGPRYSSLRAAHRAGRYDQHPLCPACDEWHRP